MLVLVLMVSIISIVHLIIHKECCRYAKVVKVELNGSTLKSTLSYVDTHVQQIQVISLNNHLSEDGPMYLNGQVAFSHNKVTI